MNKEQAALFNFGVSLLFKGSNKQFSQKNIIWKTDEGLITGIFFDKSPFENEDEDLIRQRFARGFLQHFSLENDFYKDRQNAWLNNLPEFFQNLTQLVKKSDELQHVLKIVVKDVNFLDKNLSVSSFYLFPENTVFLPVSLISGETQA